MNYNEHSELVGQHAFLSASKYHWIHYNEEKLILSYTKAQAKQRGIELHNLAKELIRLGVKLPKNNETLNSYVNDAIGFKMKPEVVVFYTFNAFGTADTLSFRNKLLRIHDLKTGETPASMEQLEVYAAYYCLGHKIKPEDIRIELRIYQSNEIVVDRPDPSIITDIMNWAITADQIVEKMKQEALL